MKFVRRHLRTALASASLCAAAALLMLAPPAWAHHPTGGKTPASLWHGFLSGIGHPVIGPDHLASIVAIGIAAALVPAGLAVIASFIAASTAGVLLCATRLDLRLFEQVIALSVIAAGVMIAVGRVGSQPAWLAIAAVAGLFHGYAFGETIIGAERAVVGSYIVGIAVIASAIAVGVMQVVTNVARLTDPASLRLRGAGVAVGCVGCAVLASSLLGG